MNDRVSHFTIDSINCSVADSVIQLSLLTCQQISPSLSNKQQQQQHLQNQHTQKQKQNKKQNNRNNKTSHNKNGHTEIAIGSQLAPKTESFKLQFPSLS